jgi:hypothetical protein
VCRDGKGRRYTNYDWEDGKYGMYGEYEQEMEEKTPEYITYVLCRSNRHSIASLAMGKRRVRHNNSNKILPRALLLALIAVVVRRYR